MLYGVGGIGWMNWKKNLKQSNTLGNLTAHSLGLVSKTCSSTLVFCSAVYYSTQGYNYKSNNQTLHMNTETKQCLAPARKNSNGPFCFVCVQLLLWSRCRNAERGAGEAVTWKSVPAHWSLLKWSLQVVLNHSNDVNTLLLFAPTVWPPVHCFRELPGPFT